MKDTKSWGWEGGGKEALPPHILASPCPSSLRLTRLQLSMGAGLFRYNFYQCVPMEEALLLDT